MTDGKRYINLVVNLREAYDTECRSIVKEWQKAVLLLTIGYSMGSISQIGALYSQGNTPRIVSILKSSLWVDLLQSVLLTSALVLLYFALPYLGQPQELIPLMRPYLVIQLCSLPFMGVVNGFRRMTDSINNTKTAMYIVLAGNIWNIFFNWLFIFGKWGCPELGIIGAAWATFTSRVLMLLLYLIIFFGSKQYKAYLRHWKSERARKEDMLLLNRLGWPIAIQMGMETASFSLCAFMLGWIGTNALAAHQVMVNLANVIFLFYVGIATAVSIRVSNYNGLNDLRGVRHASFAGYEMVLVSGIVMTTCAFICRDQVSILFTDSKEVAAIVSGLIYPLALYQVGDGMQTVFSNALRGLGDVKKLMKYSFIAYIIISLPISYLCGIVLGWGTLGIWMGFPFGLTTAGLLYLRRFLWITDLKRR
ncbi:MAG: MATE family efflux transporter, partial [Bacteroidaceae bacterium]|nr:MATE family efflux transporter [Bacteroidaceae bacterium]